MIDYQSILGRDRIQVSLKNSLKYIKNKRVLITGGGGSIGSELARQMYEGGASRLYLLGHGENSIFAITEELVIRNKLEKKDVKIVPVIGEIQDREYMKYIMQKLEADIVFHTAAHKHVPLMEKNPIEVLKNNVFGTKNVVDAAREADVDKLVFISTDKAVEPSSIYGMSKLLAEEIVLYENSHKFLVVRFGNVIGSRGSFIHTFIKQILNDIPITITDKRMKRFFMTIPEAVSLIIKVGDIGQSGELYHLEMGEPVLIEEIAKNLMKTMRHEVPIVYTGVRPGEKLEEILWSDDEIPVPTKYKGIAKLIKQMPYDNIYQTLHDLKTICFYDADFSQYFRNIDRMKEIL